ncbi:MAG: hypothetical protein FMNOHCHN_03673 [Ignavibacteriaceae bacterium]|nr:hypothetical protein [Ignavibacteriaceae bacterium]
MTDQKKIAIDLAKAHIESSFSDYMVFAFDRYEQPFHLAEFGKVESKEVLQKMYELFLAKANIGTPYNE